MIAPGRRSNTSRTAFSIVSFDSAFVPNVSTKFVQPTPVQRSMRVPVSVPALSCQRSRTWLRDSAVPYSEMRHGVDDRVLDRRRRSDRRRLAEMLFRYRPTAALKSSSRLVSSQVKPGRPKWP